jgi:anaerobic ribonucleoside-triphosphate reductase
MKTKCEVYSRVVGYLRPTQQWNEGKTEEFKDRKTFSVGDKNLKKPGKK